MDSAAQFIGPVAVGGVGGSGTRVVAEILKQLGFYLGGDLNPQNDNLWFTLLFKRRRWFFKQQVCGGKEILAGLQVFEDAMLGRPLLSPTKLSILLTATADLAYHGHDHLGSGRGLWALRRLQTILHSKALKPGGSCGWGWKEPNTHIFLEYLPTQFKTLKYIHVLRHGLDMAFSNNQAQTYNWSAWFGIRQSDLRTSLASASLKYWIATNTRAYEVGQRLLGNNFLMIKFEDLCQEPSQYIQSLCTFLQCEVPSERLKALARLPIRPNTSERYTQQNLEMFAEEDIEQVKSFGYEVIL